MLSEKKIGVLMGGDSSEREISLKTGMAIYRALKRKSFDVVAIDTERDVAQKILDEGIDIAFIALHGEKGEDGTVQGMLEIMGIPYTGAGVLASSIAMDKIISKIIFTYYSIPTPRFWVYDGRGGSVYKAIERGEVKLPLVIKPSKGGSTIGITIVRRKEEMGEALEKASVHDKMLLIEEYIEGRDMTVGILRGKALPVIEMIPQSGFYDYKAKYNTGETEYVSPAELGDGKSHEIKELALKAHNALRCKGATRVDLRFDREESAYILEVNTIPGMTETSLLPKAAKSMGIEFEDLATIILEEANEGL